MKTLISTRILYHHYQDAKIELRKEVCPSPSSCTPKDTLSLLFPVNFRLHFFYSQRYHSTLLAVFAASQSMYYQLSESSTRRPLFDVCTDGVFITGGSRTDVKIDYNNSGGLVRLE